VGWLSEAVLKISLFLVGMVVLRSINAGEDAAQGLDAQRQRGHVEQQHVLDLALQHAALDAGADRHHFIRVHALVRLLAEGLLDDLPAPWACGSYRRPGSPRRFPRS
jgi:hypothetical protein